MWFIPNSIKCVRHKIVIATQENPWDVDGRPQSVFCEVYSVVPRLSRVKTHPLSRDRLVNCISPLSYHLAILYCLFDCLS